MEQHEITLKTLRRRRFLMVLPMLALPFLTLMFVALGGGTRDRTASPTEVKGGLDPKLPDAYLKDRPVLNKMSYYDKAEKDSLSEHRQLERDRYIDAMDPDGSSSSPGSSSDAASPVSGGWGTHTGGDPWEEMFNRKGEKEPSPPSPGSENPDEAKIYSKLTELNKLIDRPDAQPGFEPPQSPDAEPAGSSFNSAPVRQMQQMMQVMQQSGGEDTEMAQINAMLEKILDIQHPERVAAKLKKEIGAKEAPVLAVSAGNEENVVSFFDGYMGSKGSPDNTPKEASQNGFYSLGGDHLGSLAAIDATVYGRQVLENGSVIKLCLSEDIYIHGALIPLGTFIYGVASFQASRLNIGIKSIRYADFLFPVNLVVYDLDGMEGIYVPGSAGRQAVSQSADQAMQTFGRPSLDPSLSAQTASAGIQTASSFLRSRMRVVRATVIDGYKVLLKDQGNDSSVIPSL